MMSISKLQTEFNVSIISKINNREFTPVINLVKNRLRLSVLGHHSTARHSTIAKYISPLGRQGYSSENYILWNFA